MTGKGWGCCAAGVVVAATGNGHAQRERRRAAHVDALRALPVSSALSCNYAVGLCRAEIHDLKHVLSCKRSAARAGVGLRKSSPTLRPPASLLLLITGEVHPQESAPEQVLMRQ